MPNVNNYNNNYASGAIGLAEIERAMGKVRTGGGPVAMGALRTVPFKPTNPCAEIKMNEAYDWARYVSEDKKKNMRKHNYKRDFNEDVWTIEVPGIKREDIEVFTHKQTLFVVIGEEKLTQRFEDDDKVASVTLDLGVLTVVVEHFEKKKLIKVS